MQELRNDVREALRGNLERVRERIARAAERAGRRAEDVRLVAVTKKKPAAAVAALLDLGADAIGENRPEDVVRKQAELARETPWHMIGHFQRKKIARALPYLRMVHSVHGLELLGTLDVKARRRDRPDPLPVLLQVNVSGERAKQGFAPDDVGDVVDVAEAMIGVRPAGLMTMAPEGAPPARLRAIFGRLRELRDAVGPARVPELSMGMSDDFEEAIAEGATLVRVGSALFDGVELGG